MARKHRHRRKHLSDDDSSDDDSSSDESSPKEISNKQKDKLEEEEEEEGSAKGWSWSRWFLFFGFVVFASITVFWIWFISDESRRKTFENSTLRLRYQSQVDLKGLKPVPIQPTKYEGLWYEHFRMNVWFEENLNDVTARYSYNPNTSRISVLNTGVNSITNEVESVEGDARILDQQPGVLMVAFGVKAFEAPYVVLYVDEEYSIAVVGSPARDTAWILTRTSAPLSVDKLVSCLTILLANGYSSHELKRNLIMVKHTNPVEN